MNIFKIGFLTIFMTAKILGMEDEAFTSDSETASSSEDSNVEAQRDLEQRHKQALDKIKTLERQQIEDQVYKGRLLQENIEMQERYAILQKKQESENMVRAKAALEERSKRFLDQNIQNVQNIFSQPKIESLLNKNIKLIAETILKNISGSDLIALYKDPSFIGNVAFNVAYDTVMNRVISEVAKNTRVKLPSPVVEVIKKAFKPKIIAIVAQARETWRSIDDIDPSAIGPWGVEQ